MEALVTWLHCGQARVWAEEFGTSRFQNLRCGSPIVQRNERKTGNGLLGNEWGYCGRRKEVSELDVHEA
jgi:hypothetical protein